MGRGGSDTTAVALAAALGAGRCDIYTDVEGIYTADPRIVPEARKMTEIGYEEMLELASYGAKMSPRSIELGAVYGVPIYVASSFSGAPGTLIHQEAGTQPMENRIKVTGIAHNANVAKITLRSVPDRPGIAAALFEPLAQIGVSVDTIVQNTSADRITDITFTTTRSDLPRALAQMDSIAAELGAGGIDSDATLASVSIVGSGMQNTPGYASRMFRTLADAKVNIDMITTSEIRISCIIREDQAAEAGCGCCTATSNLTSPNRVLGPPRSSFDFPPSTGLRAGSGRTGPTTTPFTLRLSKGPRAGPTPVHPSISLRTNGTRPASPAHPEALEGPRAGPTPVRLVREPHHERAPGPPRRASPFSPGGRRLG